MNKDFISNEKLEFYTGLLKALFETKLNKTDIKPEWFTLDPDGKLTINTGSILTDIETANIATDSGKLASADALIAVNTKISEIFRGSVKAEDDLASVTDLIKGNWLKIDNCNVSSPGNPGFGVYDGSSWLIIPFEVGMGDLDIIPEPDADGAQYMRSKADPTTPGAWVKFTSINGLEKTIVVKIKRLDTSADAESIPLRGEPIYLEDVNNFTFGDGVRKLSALPLMYVTEFDIGYTPENISNRGVPNGYAPTDATNRIPASYLPLSITESYTKEEIRDMIAALQLLMQTNLNTEITDRQNRDTSLETQITSHVEDTNIHITSVEKDGWNAKLDEEDLVPFQSHTEDMDVHVTVADKLRWDGNVTAYLAHAKAEMDALDTTTLVLGDTCFLRVTADGVTPVQYEEWTWYGTDGWNRKTDSITVIDIEWGGVKNRPASSVMSIDNAVTVSHKHLNSISLNKIGEDTAGQMTFNGVTIGAVVKFLRVETELLPVGQEGILYVILKDGRLNNYPSISVWNEGAYEILGRGLSDAPPPVGDMVIQQRELFSVVPGAEIILSVSRNEQFAFLPMEVLKLIEGAKNVTRLYSDFMNANVFRYNPDLIRIQNGMTVINSEIAMDLDTVGDRFYFSKEVDISNYWNVTELY
jgi:hypothetical protein